MRTDISCSLSPLARRRVARLALGATFAFALLGGGCAEDPPADIATETAPDAGPACEQGTRGCGCPCRAELLCIAGRCLQTEGPREPAPEPTPRPRPTPPAAPPLVDAGAEPAPSDAGPTTSDELDAEAPDASG